MGAKSSVEFVVGLGDAAVMAHSLLEIQEFLNFCYTCSPCLSVKVTVIKQVPFYSVVVTYIALFCSNYMVCGLETTEKPTLFPG